MGCLFFGINTLWLTDPDRRRVSFSFASLCFSRLISQYQYASTKWNYSACWHLFFPHLSTVLIPPVLSGLLLILPLLSWPNFQLPFCCFLFHLPNPLALVPHWSLYLSYLCLCFTLRNYVFDDMTAMSLILICSLAQSSPCNTCWVND